VSNEQAGRALPASAHITVKDITVRHSPHLSFDIQRYILRYVQSICQQSQNTEQPSPSVERHQRTVVWSSLQERNACHTAVRVCAGSTAPMLIAL
jgi:hypothetical protein